MRQSESISHWAGYSGISPKVLIALMEQESGIVSRRRVDPDAALRPFGELSPTSGFNHQLRDVAERLKAIVASEREAVRSGKAGFVAIDPIQALYAQAGREKRAAAEAGQTRFASTYAGLFGERWGSAAKPNVQNRVATKAIPSNTLLSLPFPPKNSWYVGGPHSNTGSGTIMSSLDMSRSSTTMSDQIWASAGGKVKMYSYCQVEVIHAGGWSTKYYHLANIAVANGATIASGTYLAKPVTSRSQALCQGASWTGPHVHCTLKYDGTESPLNGVTISGYALTVKSTVNYEDDCAKNWLVEDGTKFCFGWPVHH